MKKLDKLLLTSFVGPFIVSFGIALFVLIMQFLWLYIDEIAGKGVSVFVLFELIAYLSVATFPMALPIAVLIASVMVMGNLAERYELSSMKSAGISLVRIMLPLIVVAGGIAYFSYFCSNYLIPIANLQFKSRLYDIRKQKPALTLEAGVFNEDFRQFVIRIGAKAKDDETISDVMIDDQTNYGRLKFNQILADSGQMFTTDDKRFFVMNLFDGTQYQEPSPAGQTSKQKYPFIRTSFRSWQKVWDLQEFEMTATDQDRFKSQRSMLTMKQLKYTVDSLNADIAVSKTNIADDLLTKVRLKPVPPKPDTAQKIVPAPPLQPASSTRARDRNFTKIGMTGHVAEPTVGQGGVSQLFQDFYQDLKKPITEYASFEETFQEKDRIELLRKAANNLRGANLVFENKKSITESKRLEMVKSGYELYTKYTFALICLVFIFIGAPMGSIIRKGGFGYPILVTIIFFSVFITLTIACKKFAETGALTPFGAAMVPVVVLAPVGAFLTQRAMNDAQMFNVDRWKGWFQVLARLAESLLKKTAGV